RLALDAGLGVPSKLGLLIHPTWGPWLGLRAAVATDLDLSPTASLGAWNPCEGCPAPCAGACHGAAVGPRGWDMRACVESKVSDDRCRGGCDARSACVVAPEHRYDDDEIRYHSTTSAQRIEERLGPYRKLTFGVVPSRFLLRMYFFTLGRIFSKVSK
ncbi:MAG: hypothetical protein KC466_01950, partial [Myxococcales bacterium]|nr:hypothetical protein [Myxococcales bacterium]